jgi:hypothetical protein
MARHDVLVIDCDTCPAQAGPACHDCVVTYVCDRDPHTALVLELSAVRALRLLSEGGLVPALRHPAVASG